MAESTLASDIHSPSPPASQPYRTILPDTYLLDLPYMDTNSQVPWAPRFPSFPSSTSWMKEEKKRKQFLKVRPGTRHKAPKLPSCAPERWMPGHPFLCPFACSCLGTGVLWGLVEAWP